jgi:PRTRC genetic system protein D
MITAIDLGYNYTKGLASGCDRQAFFPSQVGSMPTGHYSFDVANDGEVVFVKGLSGASAWAYGNMALSGSPYSSGDLSPDWIYTPQYHVLLCAALGALHKSTIETNLVTGLPIEHFNRYEAGLRNQLSGAHTFKQTRWQTVTVNEIVVVTQPYGAAFDVAMDGQGRLIGELANGVLGIADIGGNTLNLLAIDKLREIGQWSKGDGLGLLKALSSIAEAVAASCFGMNPKPREVSQWVMQGYFEHRGNKVDIAPFADAVLAPVVDMIVARMGDVWTEPGRFRAIVLSGGGAAALGKAIVKSAARMHDRFIVLEDPLFANVRGYLKLGKRLWA